MQGLALLAQQGSRRDPHIEIRASRTIRTAGDPAGGKANVIWQDGISQSAR